MPLKLSKLAEMQIAEIQYALNCTRSEAISTALESQHAFEQITDDQIINWLDTNHPEKLTEWQKKHDGQLADVEPN